MKNSYKIALLAALGLASVTAAQAQNTASGVATGNPSTGDLVLGIYDPGVSGGAAAAANTYLVDLGATSILGLTANETWTISGLSSLSSGTQFGVVETTETSTAKGGANAYYTGSQTPNTLGKFTAWSTINNALTGQTLGAVQAGTATAVDFEANPQNSSTLGAAIGESYLVSSSSAETFYGIVDNGSSPTVVGTFTFDPSTDVLTYDAGSNVSVPEPTTYGVLAGAGLLLVSLRSKFSRKQA